MDPASSLPAFYLASGSPRRSAILAALGIRFSVIRPEIDESQRSGENAYAYARRLSQQKALTAGRIVQHAQAQSGGAEARAVVLAADTIVVVAADTVGVLDDGDILGKPTDADDARAMLRRLRGAPHIVCTALTVMRIDGTRVSWETELNRTRVRMRDYTDAEIDAYIATGDPFDKAGGYAIQHPGFAPVARIEGSYTNVVGLPVETLTLLLHRMNIAPSAPPAAP